MPGCLQSATRQSSSACRSSVQKLTDILEVVHGLTAIIGVTINELEKVRLGKVKSNGGFEKDIFLIAADP